MAKGNFKDISGQRFGKLTAIKLSHQAKRRRTFWLCLCDCGKYTTVDLSHLTSGHTKSCGCANIERIRNLNLKHGLSNSRLWRCYHNMRTRCYWTRSKEYKYYGERGIKVCDEWINPETGFETFYAWAMKNGYKEDLTLDRINTNGNYEPSNCRWVDLYTQANNKRTTRYVSVNGEVDTVARWSRALGVSYWNLLHYSKGHKNCKYPDLDIKAVNNERVH